MVQKIKNKLQDCLDDLDLSHEQAATKCRMTTQEIGRLVRGERRMTVEKLLQLCGGLDVTADRIVDIPLRGIDKANTDPVLIDSVLGFVMEASEKAKAKISKRERSELATFICKAALELKLSVFQTRGLTNMLMGFSRYRGK
jgi:transcriptional regulator with XRE-family HTH domain